MYALAVIYQVKQKRSFEKYFGTTHDIAMLAIDPPMRRRQRRLQCDLQCSQETCLRTDLWYSACYFYLLTKQLCQTILVLVKAIANWSMALMGIIIFEPTRSDHRGTYMRRQRFWGGGRCRWGAGMACHFVGENRGYGIIEDNIFNKCPLLFVIRHARKTLILQMFRTYSARTGVCESFLAMFTNTSHLSWRADLVILEGNICETTVLKFLLECDQMYDCCSRPRSTFPCFLFSWICLIILMCILVKWKYLSYGWQCFRIFYCMKWSYKCVPRRLWRLPMQLPLHVLDSDWTTKSEWRWLWILAIWYGLRVIMSIYQLPRYSHTFFIDSICNWHAFITIHQLKPWVFFAFNMYA